MSEKQEGNTLPLQEKEKSDEQTKYESAIRQFIQESFSYGPDDKVPDCYHHDDFEISKPHSEAMNALRSGQYEMADFHVLPTSDFGKFLFDFRIGDTHIYISRRASERVLEILENKKHHEDSQIP